MPIGTSVVFHHYSLEVGQLRARIVASHRYALSLSLVQRRKWPDQRLLPPGRWLNQRRFPQGSCEFVVRFRGLTGALLHRVECERRVGFRSLGRGGR
jgi:hypothetical protein